MVEPARAAAARPRGRALTLALFTLLFIASDARDYAAAFAACADADACRGIFRAEALAVHPDRCGDAPACADNFIALRAAYAARVEALDGGGGGGGGARAAADADAWLASFTARCRGAAWRDARAGAAGGWLAWRVTAQQLLLRPNEHTGERSQCVAGNVRIGRSATGTRTFMYVFAKGSTKGERKRGIVGPSQKVRLRSATLADEDREAVVVPAQPGSPLCLIEAWEPMWLRRELGSFLERPLFPGVKANGRFLKTAMTLREWNVRLKALLRAAGVAEGYSANGTRPGRRSDLGAAGVSVSDRNTAGRWASSAGERYDRLGHDFADRLPRL